VSKERRLGRGLEALLGQLPGWGGAAKPAAAAPALPPAQRPATPPPAASFGAGLPTPSPFGAGLPTPPLQVLEPPPALAGAGIDFTGGNKQPVQSPGGSPAATPAAAPSGEATDDGSAASRLVAIELIEHNPDQPRQDFDPEAGRQLAESIAEHGLLQPVVVRRVHDHYQLVAGQRRLDAARQAGWVDVPVRVIEADDRQAAELAVIENLQRKDLNAMEKAASFQRYLERYGCTQEELAGRLKLDRSTIANLIRLLELPEPIQAAVRQGKITQGHARALLPLGEEREQLDFCRRIQQEGLSVRQTEETVQQAIAVADRGPLGVVGRDGSESRPRRARDEHLAALEQEFRSALGLRVKITHNAKGRGKLVIHFADHEEFQRLREHIVNPARPLPQTQAG